jgi:hypothetical protein
LLLSIKIFTSIVSENSERAAENKILRVQEKMQKEVDRAEKAESDALAKYAEARSNVNELSEQLMAERHRLNITASVRNHPKNGWVLGGWVAQTENFAGCWGAGWPRLKICLGAGRLGGPD